MAESDDIKAAIAASQIQGGASGLDVTDELHSALKVEDVGIRDASRHRLNFLAARGG